MTITSYSNAIVGTMLGWLKGLANWVLRLFNLAGGASPLFWLANNWLKLLIFFMILGVGMDLLIWLIRWRPYWVWFRKERVIVNDERFFAGEDADPDEDGDEDGLDENWQERDYVVASTARRANRPRPSTKVPERRRGKGENAKNAVKRPARVRRTESKEDLFEVGMGDREGTDLYEDEVFNVSNLPPSEDYGEGENNAKRGA